MKKLFFLLLLSQSVVLAQKTSETVNSSIVIKNVAVINVATGSLHKNQAVVITRNKISDLGKTKKIKIPTSALVINAKGKYLIPGLWDMHIHSMYEGRIEGPEFFFPLLVANGVTGIRDMGMRAQDLVKRLNHYRSLIGEQKILGPRIFAAGAIIDGNPPLLQNEGFIPVSTDEEGKKVIREFKIGGVDFIKVYSALPKEIFYAIADEAKSQGLPFAGHVPHTLTAKEASDAGMRSMEHLIGVLEGCSTQEEKFITGKGESPGELRNRNSLEYQKFVLGTYSNEKCEQLMQTFRNNNTWLMIDLVRRRSRFLGFDSTLLLNPAFKYIPAETLIRWKNSYNRYKLMTDEEKKFSEQLYNQYLKVSLKMMKREVGILNGTDCMGLYLVPGFSVHDNLELFTKAGFTNLQALQTATFNPAKYLNATDSLGTVEVGKVADLVLLDANPLKEIRNTTKINAVILNGRYLSKEMLQKLLDDVEGSVKKK